MLCLFQNAEQEYEKEKLSERIAKLSGGVAVIQVYPSSILYPPFGLAYFNSNDSEQKHSVAAIIMFHYR